MHCLYAFVLFKAPKSHYEISELPTPPSELVIVGGGEEPYYGLFQAPVASVFPTNNIDIYPLTKYYNVYKQQTQITAHCSEFYTLNQIKVVMTKGLTPSPQTLTRSSERENICLEQLRLAAQNKSADFKFNLSQISKYKKCSPKVIASLAFRNEISLSGEYRGFLSPGKTGSINVIVDKPVNLNDVLDDGLALVGSDAKTKGQAVALFQGNLHLFQRGRKNTWYPKTTLLPTMENGKLIAQFFDHQLKVEQQVDEYIDTVQTKHRNSIIHNAWKKTPFIPNEIKPKIVVPLYQKHWAPFLSFVYGVIGEEENPLAKEG
ncbi:unnamed protein product [Blumeria hordei]|uniref:Uncharacterized protein n=1 Tax=Blumeria hordei TaxID=2867405 RepID=A0A383V249_BLUHO|nr:unnamed protein product [Blumeria hordei]